MVGTRREDEGNTSREIALIRQSDSIMVSMYKQNPEDYEWETSQQSIFLHPFYQIDRYLYFPLE
jgi:hypothetical protein